MRRRPALLLALLLSMAALSLIAYRVLGLRYPVFPTAPGKAWSISAEAGIRADQSGDVQVIVGLPDDRDGKTVTEEQIDSGDLSFSVQREGQNRMGVWSGSMGPEDGLIRYRAIVVVNPRSPARSLATSQTEMATGLETGDQLLLQRLVRGWRELDPRARLGAVMAAASGTWEASPPDAQDLTAWDALRERLGSAEALRVLLQAAGLQARVVQGLRLVESADENPRPWVEVREATGRVWVDVDAMTVHPDGSGFLPLTGGGISPVRAAYGEIATICWTVSRAMVSKWRMHFERVRTSQRFLDQWSLFRLPEEYQETFRILLLVPMGALMISVLRNVVGFPTFGIFMPVLMALAFRSTGLAYGIGMFAGIVGLGYLARRGVDRLHLLLVPRLSVLLTMVIALFTILALIGSKLGKREFMAVGLIPFVILTMTIERFFVVAEESGPRAALRTATGSAAVAAITYLIVEWEPLQLTFFVFPELLLAVAAAQILLGRYTGYRLSEVLRFRAFQKGE
jgi:hypothetical protein